MKNIYNRNMQSFLEGEFAANIDPINTSFNINLPLYIYAVMYESLTYEPFPMVW